MLLWIALAVMIAAALLFLLRPLLRSAAPVAERAELDLAVWRDQLEELGRDVERGVLSPSEAAGARLEIERRVLRAAVPVSERRGAPPLLARITIVGVALFVPVLALALYLHLGRPGVPDEPFAARGTERPLLRADGSLDLARARQGLEEKLREHPDSVEGWSLLARTDSSMGDWAGAKTAFEKALELSHRDPALLDAYGEMLVTSTQGNVTPPIREILQEAAATPTNYRSRFYLAVGKAQQGDYDGAVADLHALEKDAPPNAPWLQNVHDLIAQAEQQKGAPPPSPDAAAPKPPPEMAAIMSMPPAQRVDAIRSMVAGLAARLKDKPDDLEGWKRLGRSYGVLGEAKLSADAYAHAVALAPQDVELLLAEAESVQAIEPENGPIAPATIEIYRKVAAIDPDQVQALWYLGLAAQQAGRKDEAVADWRHLLKQLQPNTPEATEVKRQLASLGVAE
ncbi:MAG TPA: c-type cytochrome biogenesis protein CcmI [Aliidongia sp.]|nr:c-type cytochrome biogenesis protein CcmI [Aliidongia sp.]